MKTPQSRLNESFFKSAIAEQPVRMIKAAQASKLLGGGHNHTSGAAEAHKKPEIRLIHSGADYCDLEVICGCGESTQVRCWNTPSSEDKGAAK
jgi:hypothetical protein